MNFNVYLREEMGSKIKKAAKKLHRSRNSIITEALDEWLEKHYNTHWPKDFFDFEPLEDVSDFKEFRKDLTNNVSEDPLA